MARCGAKPGLHRPAALAALILCASALAALGPGAAAASPPAEVQYHIATPPPPRANGKAAGVTDEERDSPSQAILDSLTDPAALLVLGCIALTTAAVVAIGRRGAATIRPRLAIGAAGVAVSVLLLVALPGGAETQSSVPKVFWGAVPQRPPPAADFRLMREGGVDSVRVSVSWSEIEVAAGSYDWSTVDPLVRGAAREGLELLPVIGGTPAYLAKDDRTLPVKTRLQRRAWVGFLRALVRRYGPNGSFWRSNGSGTEPAADPIRSWQIWNEPNFFYFATPVSPEAYGELVKLAHRAITGVDPGARLVLAGLFARPKQGPPLALPATEFLRRLYRVPGIKQDFDAVALHPYEADADDLGPDIAAVRAVMGANGDSGTGLLLTELGWGSGQGTRFERGPEGQAEELAEAFALITDNRRTWRIKRVYWFSWDDLAGACNFCDSTGLITRSGRLKPAWSRYEEFAHGER